MSNYHKNKAAAVFKNTDPTLTAQDQAADTDINVIVRRHTTTGMVNGTSKEPIYEDFSNLPRGLRDMIVTARSLDRVRKELPPGLRDLPTEQLLTLTPEALHNILTPPAPPPVEEKKEVK